MVLLFVDFMMGDVRVCLFAEENEPVQSKERDSRRKRDEICGMRGRAGLERGKD